MTPNISLLFRVWVGLKIYLLVEYRGVEIKTSFLSTRVKVPIFDNLSQDDRICSTTESCFIILCMFFCSFFRRFSVLLVVLVCVYTVLYNLNTRFIKFLLILLYRFRDYLFYLLYVLVYLLSRLFTFEIHS